MFRKSCAGFALALLAAAPQGQAASERPSIGSADSPFDHADGTGPYRLSQERLRHQRNQERLTSSGASAVIQSADVGDVAVVVDNGSILIPPRPANPFDLGTPSGLSFVAVGTTAFDVALATPGLDPSVGSDLGLGDDDAAPVEDMESGTFPGFPFLGTVYPAKEIFVGSDGHVTFGQPDAASTPRDAARHIGGPPRVSPFLHDFDPSHGGAVHADVRGDRVVITWKAIPEFGNMDANTFQVVLHASGDIDIHYESLDVAFGVVGVAAGGDAGPIAEVDLSQDLPLMGAPTGAIFEEFAPAITVQQLDTIALAKEFYETHDDVYDFLVMFTDELVDIGGGAFAFHLGLHSDTEGLGFFSNFFDPLSSVLDQCAVVGLDPGCEFESLLNMNRIGLYWPDQAKMLDPPIRKFRFFCFNVAGQVVPCGATFGGPPGPDQLSLRARWMGTLNGDFGGFGSYTLGLNSAMSIMGQEAGHRWLAFPLVIDPDFNLSTALLGRSNAHWSFFFDVTVPPVQFEAQDGDPRASSAEGNAIADLGPDPLCDAGEHLFQTRPDELVDGYTELDQYFMGVRTPDEVTDFWYIADPRVVFGGGPSASTSARDDVLICGRRVDRSLSDITDIGDVFLKFMPSNGTRDPLIGDEQDAGPGIGPADVARCASERECVDVKTMAFILLVKDGPPGSKHHAATIRQVDNFRRVWEAYANGAATGGRGARGVIGDGDYIGKFDTSLNPVIH